MLSGETTVPNEFDYLFLKAFCGLFTPASEHVKTKTASEEMRQTKVNHFSSLC